MTKIIFYLLFGAHTKLAPGRTAQIFKSITIREVFRREAALKKSFGVVNFGRMDIMLPRSVSEATGIQRKSMSKIMANPRLNSKTLNVRLRFDTLQLVAGLFIKGKFIPEVFIIFLPILAKPLDHIGFQSVEPALPDVFSFLLGF